jgi:hypothetical protein
MIEPKYINREKDSSRSIDYEGLLSQGIELIQKFSGNQWTDLNHHDPGITLLEQICYALTDLGYKTNFPIEDILLTDSDNFDLEKNNLLIPPNEIFSSSPLTSNDFRKIIIDQEVNVKNAWVNPIRDNSLGIHGLFDVLIQFRNDLSDSQIEKSLINIEKVLMENRSLGTDFNPIIVLKEDIISLSGEININSFILGESILSEIYHKIETKLNKELKFYEFDDLLETDDYENIFSGPVQKNNYIKEDELNLKTNEIYQYEIKEIIENVEGVINVDNLIVFKNGVKMFNDIISFDSNSYPSLDKEFKNSNNDQLHFKRNNTSYNIDIIILNQLYDSIALNNKNSYSKRYKPKKNLRAGRFSKKEIQHYYSIQNELPSIYGLKKFELSSSSSLERKSQVNQLKGYLLLIEQIMANYLSQLVNVRNLFSIEIEDHSSLKTYFNQIPTDIGELNNVIDNNSSFLNFINSKSDSEKVLISRKNRVVDHLLSRFGEIYDTSLISKLNTTIHDNLSSHEIELKSLNSKIEYSKSIVDFGRDRIKGFNYKSKHEKENNISGLKYRLCLLLNIQNKTIKSTINPIIDSGEINKIKKDWINQVLKVENGPSISVLSPIVEDSELEEVNFYCENYEDLKSLFIYGFRRKNYQIIKTKSTYNLLFNSPNLKAPTNIFNTKSINSCEDSLYKILNKFKQFNVNCESFFLIENILLRPLTETKHQLIIYTDDKQKLLTSYYNTEFNQLRDLRDDLWVILVQDENFSVEKDAKTGKNIIVVYDLFNNPILKSDTQFNSTAVAEKEKTRIIGFLNSKKASNTNINEISDILITNNKLNKFPNNFKYSNHINFIFPDWPVRFQNNEFKALIYNSIKEFIPAHLSFEVFYLNFEKMAAFENVYFRWLKFRRLGNLENVEKESLQLIQLIMSYQNYDS